MDFSTIFGITLLSIFSLLFIGLGVLLFTRLKKILEFDKQIQTGPTQSFFSSISQISNSVFYTAGGIGPTRQIRAGIYKLNEQTFFSAKKPPNNCFL